MAKLPQNKKHNPFTNPIDGVFGIFKTSESFELYYLQTALDINKISYLDTASEVFDFENMKFEEMLQRDIDYKRVDNDIIKNYLEVGNNQVLFFPPILACPLSIGSEQYKDVEEIYNKNTEEIEITWDRNSFQLLLNRADEPTPYSMNINGEEYNYYNYAATFKYNPHKIKLLVIDGQHRYASIKRLIERGKQDLLNSMQIPVCLFFPSKATEESDEKISQDMRQLFVTINNTAKEVSGHFLVLLNDKSLSSMAVRSLANLWKSKDVYKSKLHLLEWNQRNSGKTNQLEKPYSITTISIISDVLKDFVFDNKCGDTALFLQLHDVEEKLTQADDSLSVESIDETNFDISQGPILKAQMDKVFTPCLDSLFSDPIPYNAAFVSFENALSYLNKDVEKNTTGARQYRDDILFEFRKCYKHDQQAVKDIETKFYSYFKKNESDDYFFRNVFQQGYIIAWAMLIKKLSPKFFIDLLNLTQAFIKSLNKFVFDGANGYFSPSKKYIQNVIYRGEKIVVTQKSKQQCSNLILITLLKNEIIDSFINHINLDREKNDLLKNDLLQIANEAFEEYMEVFYSETNNYLKKQWRYASIPDSQMNKLEALSESDTAEKKQEFSREIDKLSLKRTEEAKVLLGNILNINTQGV